MESRLQKGKVVYKKGISFTKVDFRLQIGTLEIQTGLSGCYLPMLLGASPPPLVLNDTV